MLSTKNSASLQQQNITKSLTNVAQLINADINR